METEQVIGLTWLTEKDLYMRIWLYGTKWQYFEWNGDKSEWMVITDKDKLQRLNNMFN